MELTSLGLSLVTDVGVLVAHTDHDGDMARTANDGGEDGAGSVITGEAGLWEEGDKSCNLPMFCRADGNHAEGEGGCIYV